MIRLRLAPVALPALLSLAASGCFTTTVSSGLSPAAPATVENSEKWHSGFIYGLVEVSGPYDITKICPQGWSEIITETSFLNGLVQWLTWNIYNPQTVTVRCLAGGSGPMPTGPASVTPPPATPTPPPAPPAPQPK